MTEFAVGLSVMALLLLGSITIASYQEVQRRLATAARQAAFEAAWSAGRSVRSEVLHRAAVHEIEDAAVIDAAGQRFISASDISATASIQSAPGRAGTAVRAMVEPLRAAGGFLGGSFDLSVQGLLVGSTTVRIPANPRLPEPFSAMSLELRQPLALMTDAWNASGAPHVRSRAAGLVPTGALAGLQELWSALLAPLSLMEPSLSRLCLGIMEPDRVPEDRLGSGQTPLPGRCP